MSDQFKKTQTARLIRQRAEGGMFPTAVAEELIKLGCTSSTEAWRVFTTSEARALPLAAALQIVRSSNAAKPASKALPSKRPDVARGETASERLARFRSAHAAIKAERSRSLARTFAPARNSWGRR